MEKDEKKDKKPKSNLLKRKQKEKARLFKG